MSIYNFQGALRTFILAGSGISDALSGKLYTPPVPESASYPYGVMRKISDTPMNSLNYYQGVDEDRWQVDIYAENRDDAEATADLIFDRLHMQNYVSMSGYKVFLVLQTTSNNFFEPKAEGSERIIYRIQQDFYIKRKHEITTS